MKIFGVNTFDPPINNSAVLYLAAISEATLNSECVIPPRMKTTNRLAVPFLEDA